MATLKRSLAAGAVAALGLGTVGAAAGPATAGDGHHGQHGNHYGGLTLTRSAAETLDEFNVEVTSTRNDDRARHRGDDALRLRGTVVFDGSGTDQTWSRIRVNDRTNRVTAVINGGERRAVLKFKDPRNENRRGYHSRTVLRLTDAGADSIDAAAAGDAFDRGDAFAKAGRGR